ncbi:MAG: hypothetical protein ABI151_13160 [Chitinophagaceae bacterium]
MRDTIKHSLAVLIFLLVSTHIKAQDPVRLRPVFAQASLLYDFPQSFGVITGISWPFRTIVKSRIPGKSFIRRKDRFLAVEAGFYRYPFNYTGLLLMPGYGARHYRSQSFFYETIVSLGLMRTFYDGKVYDVNATGNVTEKKLYGRFYATTHLSSAFDFRASKLITLEVKPSVWFQYPFDSFIKPHLSLQAGIKLETGKRMVR